MSPELSSYYESLTKAQMAAQEAVPAFYKIFDEIIFHRDSFENSSSLPLQHDKAFDEVTMLDLPNKLKGLTQNLESKIVSIIMSDFYVTDKNQKAFLQAQKQKQISEEIKKFEQKIVSTYKKIMESRVEGLNADAITNQVRRMYGTSLASSEEDSEEKTDSILEIENSYIIHPEDIILNTVA